MLARGVTPAPTTHATDLVVTEVNGGGWRAGAISLQAWDSHFGVDRSAEGISGCAPMTFFSLVCCRDFYVFSAAIEWYVRAMRIAPPGITTERAKVKTTARYESQDRKEGFFG